jgi:hypothetical protein
MRGVVRARAGGVAYGALVGEQGLGNGAVSRECHW